MPDPVTGAIVGGTQLVGGMLSGREARKGAESAANVQKAGQQAGLEALRADLAQYNQIGLQSSPLLMQNVFGLGAPTNAADMDAARARMAAIDSEIAGLPASGSKGIWGNVAAKVAPNPRLAQLQQERASLESRLTPQYAQPEQYKELTANQLLNDPFFNALSQQQGNSLLQERAALGLGSSGGTMDAMNRNLLLLGNDFRQQHLQNALTQNQTRFNQLMGMTQLGQNSAAQTGTAGYNAGINMGQLNSVSPLARAQERSNMFGQLGNLAGMGAMAYGQGMFSSPQLGSGAAIGDYTGSQFSNWVGRQ